MYSILLCNPGIGILYEKQYNWIDEPKCRMCVCALALGAREGIAIFS